MGNAPSALIEEGKAKGTGEFTISNTKIKAKEVARHVKLLETDYPGLSELHVRQCRLKIIPPSIVDLSALTVLDLDENKIAKVPEAVAQLPNLKELILSRNAITDFPFLLFSIPTLTSLSLSYNHLESLMRANASLSSPNLKELRLEGTGFTAFPTKVCGLHTLTSLYLADNQLSILPPEISQLTSLKTLSLSRNKFSRLPTDVFTIPSLENLDLSENEMESTMEEQNFPAEQFASTKLTVLELQHNKLLALPANLVDLLSSLVILKLHDNRITAITRQVSRLTNLKELWLQENEMSELPAEIGNLTALRKLYLEYNELKTLPTEIKNLSNLVVLILHHNQLTVIPKEIQAMRQLLRLSLDENPFQDEEITQRIRSEGALSVCLTAYPHDADSPVKMKRMSFSRSALKYTPNPTISRSLFRPETSRKDSVGEFNIFSPNDFPRRKISNPEYPVTFSIPEGGQSPLQSSSSGPLSLGLAKSAGSIPLSLKRASGDHGQKEDLIPAYSKFKAAFESLLEGQDFSKKKKEVLQRMSKEQKWSLLTQYKDSTLHLLKKDQSPTGLTLRRHKPLILRSPKDFCTALSGTLLPPPRTLRELHHMLVEGGSDVSTFIDLGGITFLVRFLENLAKNPIQEASVTNLIVEGLNCMRALVEIGLKSVLTTLDAINVAVLHIASPVDSVVVVVLEIVREILDVTHIGYRVVQEALAYTQSAKKFSSPYIPFVDILKNPEFPVQLKINCMNILNTIVDYAGGVEARFDVECELLTLHFLDIIEKLHEEASNELLNMEMDIFEQSLDDDEQEMVFLVGRKEVLRRLGHNLSPRDDIARVVVGLGGGVAGECVNVPITPASTCHGIVKEILTKFPVYSNLKAEWGLFVPDLKADSKRSQKEEGYWLDLTKKPSEYRLSGEILEFRMKELSILAGLRDGPCEIMKVDPYLTVAEITEVLRRKFKQNNLVVQDAEVDLYDDYWQEYGLYLYSSGHYAEGEWLDDTKKLADFDTSLKRVALRLRKRPLAIAFGSTRATHTLHFDPDMRIKEVILEISRSIPAADRANLDRYGLFLESHDITKPAIWLEEDKKLRDYYIPKQGWVKFMRKPRPLKIKVALSIEMPAEVVVDQAGAVGDELLKLQNHFAIPEDYDVTWRNPETKAVAPLSRELTFAEQGVLENSTLFLKPKGAAALKDQNIWDEPNWGEYKSETSGEPAPASPRAGTNSTSSLTSSPSGSPVQTHHDKHGHSSHSHTAAKQSVTIATATLNKMLEHLTSPDAYDPEMRDVFLLTYPSFTTTQRLLEKMIERYTIPPSMEGSSLSRLIQQRVIVLCKHWIKFTDSNKKLSKELEDAFALFFVDKANQEKYHEIQELYHKCFSERNPETPMVYSEPPPKPRIPKQITAEQKLTWWDIDDLEIARQLTLLTFSIYSKINSHELLQQNWMKSTTAAPYVNGMIGVFNKASQWVSTAILTEKLLRNRVKMLTKMIKVAQFLLELNNFHLLMAFVSSLNSSAIARLKWTHAKLSRHAKETMEQLEKVMSMEGSFKSYRVALTDANPPVIPYIGVHLTDLVFIDEGNPRMVGPRINFVRHKLVASAITSVQRYQKIPPNLTKVDVIQSFFANLPVVSEEKELFKLSLICEPRNARAPPD